MFTLDLVEALLILSLNFFNCAIYPELYTRVTTSCNHTQLSRLVSEDGLAEVHRPDLLLMHLKSVLTHLLLDVPNFDDSIYGC